MLYKYLRVNFHDSRRDRVIMLALDRWRLHSPPHNVQWIAACLTDHSSDAATNERGRESRNSHRVHCSSTRSHHRTWSTQHFEIRRRSGLSRVAIKVSTVPISGETGCPRRAPSVPCFTIIYNSHSHSYNPRLSFFRMLYVYVCMYMSTSTATVDGHQRIHRVNRINSPVNKFLSMSYVKKLQPAYGMAPRIVATKPR